MYQPSSLKTYGQGLVEYSLIIVFIVLVVLALVYGPGLFVHSSLNSVVTEFPK